METFRKFQLAINIDIDLQEETESDAIIWNFYVKDWQQK